jgi:hypothetical protein
MRVTSLNLQKNTLFEDINFEPRAIKKIKLALYLQNMMNVDKATRLK